MTLKTPVKEHPVIKARDDDGSGFTVLIMAEDRRTVLLEAQGASLTNRDHGSSVRITLRSDRQDFESDYLYLLVAEFVGTTTWVGRFAVLSGVLTEFLWRSEEDIDEEMKLCPSGDGIYHPKGPRPEPDMVSWQGKPYPMTKVEIRVFTRENDGAH